MRRYWRVLAARLRRLFDGRKANREFDGEIEAHLRALAERYVGQGMTEEEAAWAARRQFGNITLLKEVNREMRGIRFVETFKQDIRYGFWMLRRNPGFALVAICTLALGIGANTAIFSVVNALVLNPLPYPDPQRLVWVTSVFHGDEVVGADLYFAWREQSKTFDELAAFEAWTFTPEDQGEPERVRLVSSTTGLFPTLGVAPWLGRGFTPEDDRPGAAPAAVLNYDFWQRRFGGAPSVVGQSFKLAGQLRQVIGIMPPGFRFLPERRLGGTVDLWVPFRLDPQQPLILDNLIGRLKPGVSIEQAQSELALLLQRFQQATPQMPPGFQARVTPLAERLVGHLRRGLLTLLGAVGFILLIACANVASLLLARANLRQKEMAIRASLGAGRRRLIMQLLTESLLLSLIGGVLGLLVAQQDVSALVALAPDDLAQLRVSRIDASVLGFAFLATLVTGVAAGLIPALQASQVDLNDALKDGARHVSFLMRGSSRYFSPVMIIGELALTLVLLIGAGLLIKSFLRLRAVEPGYNPKNLLTMLIPANLVKDPPGSAQQKLFHRELLARLNALPGVLGAASATTLPMIDTGINGKGRLTLMNRPSLPDERKPMAEFHEVSPDYFRVMGMPLRAGRGFTEQDDEPAPSVIVINETLARRHFNGESPVGQRIRYEGRQGEQTIIGVVADVKRYGLSAEAPSEVYHSYYQNSKFPPVVLLAVRTAGDPLRLAPAMRQQIQELGAGQAIYDLATMEHRLDESVTPQRFQAALFVAFAIQALLIALVGIYGTISYAVGQRTREIGIRMALGAQAGDVIRMVIRRGMGLTLIGVALGVAAAFALTRVMKGWLFEVSATDPATFVGVALLLALVALLACWIPARRATRGDPITALRHD
ncbi:MAG TPA: ABC transporter permease [Blastocatellia bacterium]|nr:ABC transporter permease [Blastocatellia bacterium]